MVSLALLLTNDVYLKAAYPGWVTGKLSDFAGLLVFSLFLFPLLPIGARKIAGAVAAFFIWWKSPCSDFAIDFVNSTGLTTIGRVIDYSDLIALTVLPLAVCAYERVLSRQGDLDVWRKVSLAPIAAAALLGITGTSKLVVTRPVEIRSDENQFALSPAQVDAIIEMFVESPNDECWDRRNDQRTCVIDSVWFTYFLDEDRVRFAFEYSPSGRLTRKVERLIDSLKGAFAEQAGGLSYVEPLTDQRRPSGR